MTSPDDAFPVALFWTNHNKQLTARISGLNIQNGGLNNDNASRPISFLASIIHDKLAFNLVLGTNSVKHQVRDVSDCLYDVSVRHSQCLICAGICRDPIPGPLKKVDVRSGTYLTRLDGPGTCLI